ncbi:MAG: nucleotidyltransferase family protein [Clostridia bacterium]|nr:nucleotidyltransferase family protein [Clostridia bacterium]
MDRLREIVCAIIKESLYGEDFDMHFNGADKLDDNTMAKVFSELSVQTVLCFADNWLIKHKPQNEMLFEEWCRSSRDYQIRVLYILSAQQKLVELLNANGIDFVIIKGTAAAVYYSDPLLRMMGDVDLLVKRADFERASKLLEQNGFEHDGYHCSGEQHHEGYVKYNVRFELHRRLPIVDENNDKLLKLFEDGIDERIGGNIEFIEFPMLPHRLNGIVLLFHINQHLRVGLGLRQILDWMMFVDKNIDDAAWQREYRQITQSVGLDKFAKIVTRMCQMHLGLNKELTWCADADPEVCDSLLNYIIDKGNFGIKAGREGYVASVFLRSTNPFKILARLQQKGRKGWDKAEKYAVCRPFAWIHALCMEIKQIRGKNISISKMNDLKKEGLRQRQFIESLGLDADRKIYEVD